LETLNLIYTIKIFLGFLAAIICLILGINQIINGGAIAALIYLVSDRILRQIFIEKVEKVTIVTKTGVGIYIITWLFLWIILYTSKLIITPS
jgi:hypothetical protein